MPRPGAEPKTGVLLTSGCCGVLLWMGVGALSGHDNMNFAIVGRCNNIGSRSNLVGDMDLGLQPIISKSPLQGMVESSVGSCLVGLIAMAAVSTRLRRRPANTHARSSQGRLSSRRVSCRAAGAVPILRLGTRGSPLALAQAFEAKRRLGEAFPELAPDDAVQIQIISTTGDQRLEISLSEIGGKGLFTRELDVALASKEVDFCVHSTKDVPTDLMPDTELCTMLPREDTRDVLISGDPNIKCIEDFPVGSLIGTASLRRQAQIYAKNPNVKCVNFRGNVQTRLRKLKAGDVKGTFLAYAGLKRMNMEEHLTKIMDWDEMLPAISQGAISFQCRSDDERVLNFLKPLSHLETFQEVTCERAFLAALDGNCKTPIAGQAKVESGQLRFVGLVSSPDGQRNFRVERTGAATDAIQIGREAGLEVRKEAGEKFFEEMQIYVQQVQAANSKPTKS